jgi:DNA helicase-2/ATP-dependent DNA helicase PcrA
VHGRIDAVFEGTATGRAEAGRYEVVDWKTGSSRGVDARQLAIYRLAWAQLAGVDVAEVSAAFVMVGSGEVIRPDTSAEVAELLALSR